MIFFLKKEQKKEQRKSQEKLPQIVITIPRDSIILIFVIFLFFSSLISLKLAPRYFCF